NKNESPQWEPICLYKKGELIDTMTTTNDGAIHTKELPLGKYELIETSTPVGYMPADPITVELTPGAQDIRVISKTQRIVDEKQSFEFNFIKTFEESSWFQYHDIAGRETRFGLFTRHPLIINDVTLPADSCLDITELDEHFTGSFTTDFAGEYYIKELTTHEAYSLADDVEITAFYKPEGQQKETIHLIEPIKNKIKRGDLNILKVDSETGAGLAGATFKLYTIKDQSPVDIGLFTTDQEGKISVHNLEYGQYFLTELNPPDGYYPNDNVTELSIDGIQELMLEIANLATITEVRKTGDSTDLLAGAELLIKDSEGEIVSRFTSGAEPHTIRGLIAGEIYTLVEETPPAGYKRNPDPVTFTVSEDGSVNQINISNQQTEVVITKRDAMTDEPLAGAEIEIYDSSGTLIYKGITDHNGQIKVNGLIPGAYSYCEVQPPLGYAQNPSIFSFVIDSFGQTTGELDFTNEPTELIIKKTTEDGQLLADAHFKIVNETGQSVTFRTEEGFYAVDRQGDIHTLISDNQDLICIRYLPQGTYKITEVQAPAGYEVGDPTTVVITSSTSTSNPQHISISNRPLPTLAKSTNSGIQNLPRTGESRTTIMLSLCLIGCAGILFGTFRQKRHRPKKKS
ncbi:MAG TPA: hypothetical protein GX717_04200, partial [Clostridiaceae bacterium]|nr:hypothetical protein [Clostridiaceae bacterium]